jgi:hypothetical protein
MTGRLPFGVPQRSETSLQIMHVQQAVFLLRSRPPAVRRAVFGCRLGVRGVG